MHERHGVIRHHGKKGATVAAVICIAAVCAAALFLQLRGKEEGASGGDSRYAYITAEASNGMRLHALVTDPSLIALETIHANVAKTPYYGVNGGFFYGEDLLSIAMTDGKPANGELGAYGSGSANVKYARGTLVWDGAAKKLGVQIVKDQSELRLSDNSDYWAQGGISMSIGQDEAWEAQADREGAPFPDDERLRSAAAYDADGRLYLVVSSTKGTLAAFREAVLEQIGGGKLAGGIFLDGDGSSQLRSREQTLPGDGRPVVQMMRLKQQ